MLSKQLFFVTNDQLCAFEWRRGKLGPGTTFSADQSGTEAFGAWLARHRDTPAYVVADVIEEDFQRHLLPHVGGSAGRALRERRLGQVYRDTPFRHAAIQGRERDGRRDDLLLFCALTNPAPITHWLSLIEAHAVPLAALYSAALLSALLLRRLALARPHLLLVTQQMGGLRESYFQGQALKFSRLTTLPDQVLSPATLLAEVNKTRQFLTSTHLIERDESIEVALIAPAATISALEPQDSAGIRWRFIDIADAGTRLGIDESPRLSDRLLLAAAARHTPAGHYHPGAAVRFYRIWQARLSLRLGTAAMLALGVGWSAANLWGAVSATEQGKLLRIETAAIASRYRLARENLPASLAAPANMKAAVRLEQMLSRQGPNPAPMLAVLSAALDQLPHIVLRNVEWQVSKDASALSSASLGLGARPHEMLRIEAELALDQGNYRGAFDGMHQLVRLLAANPGMQVRIVTAPLDVDPQARLSGKVGTGPDAAKASFSLQLVWTP